MLAVSGIASGDGGRPLGSRGRHTAQPLTVGITAFKLEMGGVETRAVAHLKGKQQPLVALAPVHGADQRRSGVDGVG